jgi:hypothetical protein
LPPATCVRLLPLPSTASKTRGVVPSCETSR